jgi:KUP system potassium uptake protein
VSGYIYILASGPIAWHSKKQPTIALSTGEAEYLALTASRHAIWLRYLFEALPFDFPTQESTIIYSDNQTPISIAYDPQHHARSKHFRIENHFIRECVELGIVNVEYCPTNDMIADIFTHALSRAKHQQFGANMGLLPA